MPKIFLQCNHIVILKFFDINSGKTKEYIREGGFIQIFATETAVIFEALFGTRQLNFGILHIEKSSIMIKIYKLVRKSPIWRSEAPDRQIGDFLAQKSPKKKYVSNGLKLPNSSRNAIKKI